MSLKTFKVSENGFSIKDNKVSVPACEIKALSWLDAQAKLSRFLETQEPDDDIKLITPMERIDFEAHRVNV